ncbi:type II secretion system protein [Pseudomonas aeruginosa]|uniref:type II secretion system protein n=1 Tax=Pseudomonas aeruginosa TaxID=287 RepID=UPI003EE8A073|nr:type II secretion system protein [Pseudomonas aeruginosa]
MIKKRGQAGFTLIEMMVVIAVVGVLILIVASSMRGSSDSANATAIRSSAKTLATAIGYLNTTLGTGLSATANALPKSGLNMMDVIMTGEDSVSATFLNAYRQQKMRPLESEYRVIQRASGTTPGTYQLVTYPITFVACTTGKVCIQYQNVPSETVGELATRSGIPNFNAATAKTTGAVRYTAADGQGYHTVTMEATP